MRIQVTEENIDQYDLVRLTGKSKAELLSLAVLEWLEGNEFWVRIPDVAGGDTEAPTDRNVFEHFTELPVPDGHMHEQKAANLFDECSYKLGVDMVGRGLWVCVVHAVGSKYPVDGDSHAPCLIMEP